MIQSTERAQRKAVADEAFADLASLVAVIAASPIVVQSWTLEARLADWDNTRGAADVDDVVLAWIASHVDRPGRRATLS